MRRYLAVPLLILFAVVLLSPLIFGGETFYYRDFGRFYDPVKRVCIDRMRAGEFPLWLPEINCGTPVHGELVHGLLYPGNLFLLLSGGKVATVGWGLYFAFHIALGGIGAWLLARHLGAGETGGIVAGLAFAGSGYLVAQMNHVPYATAAAWIPLVLYFGLRAGDGVPWSTPLLALCLAATALAGEPLTIVMGLLVLLVLILAGACASRRRALIHLAVAGGISLLLASPALIPAGQQLTESMRAGGATPEDPLYGSVHPVRLLTLLSPEALGRQQFFFRPDVDLFGLKFRYVAPVLTNLHLGGLVLLAMLIGPFRHNRLARVLGGLVLGAIVFALGGYLGISTKLMEILPGLTVFRYPDKYWFIVTIAAAVLAGLTVDRLGPKSARFALVLGVLAFVMGWELADLTVAILGAVPLLFVGVALLLPRRVGRPALVGILFLDLLVHGYRVSATIEPDKLHSAEGIAPVLETMNPRRIFVDFKETPGAVSKLAKEVILASYNALDANLAITDGISYSFGYDPVEPIRRIPLYFGVDMETEGPQMTLLRHRLLRLVDNTHSITNAQLGEDPAITMVIRGPHGIAAYAYEEPLPRARLCANVLPLPDLDAVRMRLHDLAFDPFNVLLIEDEGPPIDRGPPVGSVVFEVDEPERVRLRVQSDRPAWLVLADAYSMGWEATRDGKPVRIRPAMVALRAVPVPAGPSIVEFRYRPSWLGVVPFTFGAGFLALLVAFGLGIRLRRRREGTSPEGGRS